MKILVVENEPSVTESVVMALAKAGYETLTASTAELGLQAMRSAMPDLVIADVDLPATESGVNVSATGSGFDFCRTLRQSSTVPLIVLASCIEESECVLCRLCSGVRRLQCAARGAF